jgi:hypothetical protein
MVLPDDLISQPSLDISPHRNRSTFQPVQTTVGSTFLVMVPNRKICVFNDYAPSDNILFLTILSMKQCIYIEVRPHMCVEIKGVELLAAIGSLCCVGYTNPIGALLVSADTK